MKSLLIAEALPLAADALSRLLSGEWDIQICTNHVNTVEIMAESIPDALIVCQQPGVLDANAILADCFPDVPHTILVISPSATQNDLLMLSRWGVDCVFESPCDLNQLRLTLNLLHESQSTIARRVVQHLRVLGIVAGGNNYLCLLTAITLFRQDMTQQLHNDVYCRITRDTGMDERSIEKAIRTLIHNAWARRDARTWAKYFPVDEQGDVACPKNKEFIMTLAQLV